MSAAETVREAVRRAGGDFDLAAQHLGLKPHVVRGVREKPPSVAASQLLEQLAGAISAAEERATRSEADAATARQESQRRAVQLAQAPLPMAAPEGPANVDLLPMRDGAGRLHRVTMKAEGYADAHVDIERGGDNRIRALKVTRK